MLDDLRKQTESSTSQPMARVKCSRKRSIGVISKENYDCLRLKLEGGDIPKDSKTVKFYHVCQKIRKFNLSLTEIHNPVQGEYRLEIIDGDRKIVISKSELDNVICKFYTELRGSGAKKIRTLINQYYAGISQEAIQDFIDRQDDRQLLHPKFVNAAKLKPVISRTPMGRHQVDLVGLTGMPAENDGETFIYILSVIDVFTRFLWLRPLSNKRACSVALELHKIYFEYGWANPRILQCDQGSEFKGAVNQLCIEMGTKIVRSRAHHPQSQGKSERSHRDWKSHLEFDHSKHGDGESFNWVEKLPAYARIHNESIHSALGCSPYKAMLGCPPVHFKNLLRAGNTVDAYSCSEEDEQCELSAESDEDTGDEYGINGRIEAITNLRKNVLQASLTKSSEMIQKHHENKDTSVYKIGDEVLVRVHGKDTRVKRGGPKKGMKKRKEGTIVEIDSQNSQFKVAYPNKHVQWEQVCDITSRTRKEEKRRRMRTYEDALPDAREEGRKPIKRGKTQDEKGMGEQQAQTKRRDNAETKGHKKTPTMKELEMEASFYDLDIVDNEGAGNCMFIALAQQLQIHDIDITSHKHLREKVVQYVQGKQRLFKDFVDKNHYPKFRDYIIKMKMLGEWGDNIILGQQLTSISEEQLQRHDEFVSGFPTPDRRVNFAEGYLSQYMQQKMLQYLISALTLTRLKDTRRIYSGSMRLFKCKVEKKLELLTQKHMIAATDYLMYVGVKEAIIYILMDVLNKPYEEVNYECKSTEFDASQVPGRGVHITVDDE
ncbi:uncharacterized protein LOC124117280 [Haliotis rufescens]|uniref:uncharacterized protein LOC124117280 n=1 Tax=Haliotis rufescens TaxID=6454 RepID=UPI00201EA8A7|nr:uncharacterized protein LOC124117280 [Haliotis rufescens]XP_048236370.1 uncharacterized protein LOC124117280 [Haliotis rufescens]